MAKGNAQPKTTSSTATIGKLVDDAMVAIERDFEIAHPEVRRGN